MLDTIKKRLLFLTTTILLVFSLLVLIASINSFIINKNNRKINTETQVAYIAEKISNIYEEHSDIARELSAIASVFYQSKKQDKNILISTIKNNYKDKLPKAGVGIWFDEFKINPAKKWFCVFAYLNDENKIVFNTSLENDDYNYVEKPWFLSIQQKAKQAVKNIYTPTTCAATGKNSYVLTIGSGVFANEKLVGIITVDWLLDEIKDKIADFKPTKNSYILFADKHNDFIIALTNATKDVTSNSLSTLLWYKDSLKSGDLIKDGNKVYVTFPTVLDNGLLLIVNVPIKELYGDLYTHLYTLIFLMILVLILLFVIIHYILTKNVNKPIEYLVNTAKKIGNGDLETKMEIKEPLEFSQLADAFNKMTSNIKEYITNLDTITAEKKKMEAELSIASSIQAASLPSIFPPYPDKKEFDIYANMVPAKEVGGDFYDFFFADKNNFVFLIADVSGKGVPAALFMMETKTLLRNIIKTGIPLNEAISKTNHKVCKKNKQGFFVTAFIAKINLLNGNITYVNAGHNPPLLKRNKENYSYLKIENNLVIGAVDSFIYKEVNDKLSSGDELFFYTDGITEAINNDMELFGENRLIDTLNQNKNIKIEAIIPTLKHEIHNYIQEQSQSDDMTTLVFRYNGIKKENIDICKNNNTTLLLPANIERFSTVIDWIEDLCNKLKMKNEYKYRINIAVEEIFVNISTYAYPPKDGDVEIIFTSLPSNEIEIQFSDSGTPYNPLEKPDPNINENLNERKIGGLGIYMTKNSMDSMDYKFVDGKNILTMKLKYETEEN